MGGLHELAALSMLSGWGAERDHVYVLSNLYDPFLPTSAPYLPSYDPAGGPRIQVGVTHFISEKPLTKRQKRRLRGKAHV